MRLIIKNKMVSWGGASKVLDEEGNDVFKVKGKVFTVTKKKRICDLDGKVLYRVRNKYWHLWLNKYAYISDAKNHKIARIKFRFGVRKKFFIEGYQDEISVEGDVWGWNYSIVKNGETIGRLSRKFDLLVDHFVLDVESEENMAFLVAVVIAIDNIYDNQNSNN